MYDFFIRNAIKKKRLITILNSLSSKEKKRANELFRCLYKLNVTINEVIVKQGNRKFSLLLLPHVGLCINTNEEEIEELQFFDTICQKTKLKQRPTLMNIHDVVSDNLKIETWFVNKCINVDYYRKKEFVQSGDIVCNRYQALELFGLTKDLWDEADYYDTFGIASNDDNSPSLFIYSRKRSEMSLASNRGGTILREILSKNIEIANFKNEKRLVFESIKNFQEIGIAVEDDHRCRLKRLTTWKEEKDYPLSFAGLYEIDLNESEREGLLVWRRISARIGIPS